MLVFEYTLVNNSAIISPGEDKKSGNVGFSRKDDTLVCGPCCGCLEFER